jgi:hypothetical protein
MARDILGEFGKDSGAPQAPRATNGGQVPVRDVNNYSPPQGPNGIGHCGPGLGGDNYGITNGPSCHERESGRPGLGGDNRGTKGSQK